MRKAEDTCPADKQSVLSAAQLKFGVRQILHMVTKFAALAIECRQQPRHAFRRSTLDTEMADLGRNERESQQAAGGGVHHGQYISERSER